MRERQRERHGGNESLSLLSVITWVESYYRNQNTDQWPRKTADFSLSLVLHTQWKCFTQAHSFEEGGGIVSMIINNIIYQRIPKTVRPHQLVKPWKSFLPLENTLKQDFPSYH